MDVRALTVDEVARYRTIRLDALRSDPAAFGSTHEREVGYDDATWRARLSGMEGRAGVVFVLDDGGRDLGMTGVARAVTPGDVVLWGMWVRPEARGTGAADRLIGAVIDWARADGATAVVLWVVRSNAAAIRCYERAGFVEALDQAGAPSGPCGLELAMRRPL